MALIYLSLGSNINRERHIGAALDAQTASTKLILGVLYEE